MGVCQKASLFLIAVLQLAALQESSALPVVDDLRSSSIFQSHFARFLPHIETTTRLQRSLPKQWTKGTSSASTRRTLADDDDDGAQEEVTVSGMSVSEMRRKISDHRLKLVRLRQESKDLAHERAFLEKTLELKKGQRTMQDGQVKLSQAELEDKAKEIEMYKREAPRTLSRYNELVRKQKDMQETLNRLHQESEELSTSKKYIMDKIQHLNMEDLIERHARGLPEAMAGALRKSAAALIPFFDYLVIAADTNNRLVDHVGAEIDKYTHVNISSSPFMSGILFYCVLLIPLLTFISFVRRVFDSSSKLTVSHYIIFGNLYFVIMCLANLFASFILRDDPMNVLFQKFERTFIIGNLLLSAYYAWHVVMLGLQTVYTLEKRNISQFLATVSVGIHYFLFAWRRMFTDHAPMMYTFNYMVYGTIFCFIVYERYNRMSSRQLNDSAVFRLVHLVLKRRSQLSSLQGLKNLGADMWTTTTARPGSSQRRFSKRNDRYLISDRGKAKSDTKERPKGKVKHSYSSDEYGSEVQVQGKSEHSSNNHRKNRNKQNQSTRTPEPRGFISIFFGSREDGDDSSDEEERIPPRSGWRFLRGRNASVATPRPVTTSEATRTARSARSHRTRDKKEPRPARISLWKWS